MALHVHVVEGLEIRTCISPIIWGLRGSNGDLNNHINAIVLGQYNHITINFLKQIIKSTVCPRLSNNPEILDLVIK